MDKNMFCFQCEQTIGCSGCTGNSGVCGKTADTAKLQDELTGALIGLARAVDSTTAVSKKTSQVIIEGLFTTVTNVNFDNASIESMIQKVRAEKERLAPDCRKCQSPCGKTDEYDMQQLWNADEDTRSLKSLILFGIRGMAAYAYHAAVLGHEDDEVNLFFCEALFKIGYEENTETLLSTVLKVGEINLKCMALLDKANTETYGTPEPTEVTLTVEKGPFIVVTGHDLKDLQLLLEQTSGKGINIYTHGEMLPAHAYPFLKKFPHLKGNFGTAWQNQQKEFDHLPAPILYTTNCLMPPKSSYADRVFTTEMVAFPGTVHIDEKKDFTPVIEKALELGGYKEDQILTGINGGTKVTTGFGHAAILSHADTVIKAVKSGDISHFFLVAGCDGAKPDRNYYTEFVKQAPSDSVILTLACGKFRFNDLDLGEIGGLPRLMDIGQCNDAYGAIQVAVALADAFECSVNELPLSFVLSWYEQKAVCILLTLLHLGIKNIRLGPSLPAFLSPNILDFLVENYGIGPITTPEEDIKALAEDMNISVDEIKATCDALHEFNPMMGHRGCRLAVTYPEIAEMQTRAVIEAAIEVHEEKGYNIVPEIMIPLVGEKKELKFVKDIVVNTAEAVKAEKNSDMHYKIGTMIEIPRAALLADEIASEAEFFSFGTNDLTQMTFGFSRDDAGKFLDSYYKNKIYESDPFARLDKNGVGQLVKMAVEKGRSVRPDLKCGICGEHGGDPSSIEFCHQAGLDYVSCSPFRVPIARLAAAQAAIANAGK